MATMQKQNHYCPVCKDIAKNECGSCGSVYYCSRDHQTSHWKIHSQHCEPYKLVANSQLGTHYVATRNIKFGNTVVRDKYPLVTAPQNLRDLGMAKGDFTVGLKVPPTCLSCYVVLKIDNAKRCKCGWYICRKCTEHGSECEFTKKHAKSKIKISAAEYEQAHPAYDIVGLIRALALRENDPKSYEKLMNLQDPVQSLIAEAFLPDKAVREAVESAKTLFNIDHIEEAELSKIIRIILNNSFTISRDGYPYRAVYGKSSRIQHSCNANCSQSITDEGGIIIWAAVPISKGDHITVSYISTLSCTLYRKRDLANIKFIDCNCERCRDPTEFGTMFGARKCQDVRCDGWLIPSAFSATGENYCPDYVCSKCSTVVHWASFLTMDDTISAHQDGVNTVNMREYRGFCEKWQKDLHENHHHIFRIQNKLALAFGLRSGDLHRLSDERVKDLIDLCKKLIRILRIIAPAETQPRALLLFVQSRAMKLLNIRYPCEDPEMHFQFLMNHQELLKEIYQLLRRERAFRPAEKEIATTVIAEIRKLETLPEVKLMVAANSMFS